MDNNVKPLPKSLHTVTVIVRVATLLCKVGYHREAFTDGDRVSMAIDALGYPGELVDPHGLAAAALKQLQKDD